MRTFWCNNSYSVNRTTMYPIQVVFECSKVGVGSLAAINVTSDLKIRLTCMKQTKVFGVLTDTAELMKQHRTQGALYAS